MDRLSGRRIVVTGAGSGIGRGLCMAFVREGATVGVMDRDAHAARSTAEAAAALDPPVAGRAIALVADVTQRSEVSTTLDVFLEEAGGLDAMFNNAGLNKPMHLLDVTEENWHAVMDVNALGTLIGIQEAARRMIPRGGGKIVNTSSIAGRQGYPSFAPYCASKFAVNALTQVAARALAADGITCNAFAPGVVETPLWNQLDEDLRSIGDAEEPGQAMAEFSAGILRGRPATPDDLVGTATFLASSDSDYITGQVVMVDGGMVLV